MIRNLNSPKIIIAKAKRRLERPGILEAWGRGGCPWEGNVILKEEEGRGGIETFAVHKRKWCP